MSASKIRVGLLGLGRLGKVYAQHLEGSIPCTELVAAADPDAEATDWARRLFPNCRTYQTPQDLLQDRQVDAIVVATPTHTHKEVVEASIEARKPLFCEKPLSLSLAQALAMQKAVADSGSFFQMGFMRRFDPAYAAAKSKIDSGVLGKLVLFKSTSRDPFRPSLEYLNPESSGGIFVDMGIHDFDLALWFFGAIQSLSAIGGVLAYPEVAETGDVDNAVVSLRFRDQQIGAVDLSRSGIYGYDIRTEILGTEGTLQIGYLRETALTHLTPNSVAHDTVPHFMQRFASAYRLQLEDFAQNLILERPPSITIEDGIEALRVALAATQSYQSGETVQVGST